MKIKKNDKLFKCLLTINALLILLIFTTTNAFADFYVIAGSRGVGTKINSLPATIASPGFYYIAQDLNCPAGNHGITITADNVTLDLMGFSLGGPGGSGSHSGIFMDGRANVEIRNGTIGNFNSHGICESGVGEVHRIINVRVKYNASIGISLNCGGCLVENCTAVCNGETGILTGTGCTVTGNTCYSNGGTGIGAITGCTVTGNTCLGNGNIGIGTSHGCTITGNTCYSNDDDGIHAGTNSTVIGNTCCNNAGYGIYLVGYNYVDQNTAINNTGGNMYNPGTCIFGLNRV